MRCLLESYHKMSCLLAVLLLLLIPASSSMDVAPQDADNFCLTDESTAVRRISDPRQVVLLDTFHYRPQTLMTLFGASEKWISLKLLPGMTGQRWADLSQTESCVHQLVSCYFTFGQQNNWLITQYINISNPDVTDLNVNANFSTNVGSSECTGSCVQSVPIHFYWTNTLNETERNDTSNFGDAVARLLHIGNNGMRESANLVTPVSAGFNGMYLALVDEGTCVYISRLVVSYTVCPAQNLDLISYPQTVAPTVNNVADKQVPVSCVEGASSTAEAESLECNFGGLWGSMGNTVCQCDPGYQLEGTGLSASCKACPPENFKPSRSNTEICRPCPNFSSLPAGNQAVCMCDAGYYRTQLDSLSDDCTAPPTAPRNVVASVVTGIFVILTWSPPSSTGGRSDLEYDVSYTTIWTTRPITRRTPVTRFTLIVAPLTDYLISVEAVNGVSEQLGNSADRTVSIHVTTPSIFAVM